MHRFTLEDSGGGGDVSLCVLFFHCFIFKGLAYCFKLFLLLFRMIMMVSVSSNTMRGFKWMLLIRSSAWASVSTTKVLTDTGWQGTFVCFYWRCSVVSVAFEIGGEAFAG